MGDVESAIAELVRETIDEHIPSEEDLEKLVESNVGKYVDRYLMEALTSIIESDTPFRLEMVSLLAKELKSQGFVCQQELDALREELSRKVETHTLRYRARTFKDRVKAKIKRMFRTGRKTSEGPVYGHSSPK